MYIYIYICTSIYIYVYIYICVYMFFGGIRARKRYRDDEGFLELPETGDDFYLGT